MREILVSQCTGIDEQFCETASDNTEYVLAYAEGTYTVTDGQGRVLCEFLRDTPPVVDDIPTSTIQERENSQANTSVIRNRPEHYYSYKMIAQTEDGEPLYKRIHKISENNPVGYCPKCGKRLCSGFKSFCPNCGIKICSK